MQMGQGIATGGITPPAPQIQKPIGVSHSRSSSHASASSQQSAVKLDGEMTKLSLENHLDKVDNKEIIETNVAAPS